MLIQDILIDRCEYHYYNYFCELIFLTLFNYIPFYMISCLEEMSVNNMLYKTLFFAVFALCSL